MTKLKPCPFCGGEARFIKDGEDFWVNCENKDCLVMPYVQAMCKTEEEAIEAWNMRADDKYSDDGK